MLFCSYPDSSEENAVSTSSSPPRQMSLVFCPVFSEGIDLHLVRFFPFLLISPIVTSGVGWAICFWDWAEVQERGRESVSRLARQQECVTACTSADAVQLQGKPGWNSQPEAPGQAAVRPAPWLPSHLCLTPGGFLAGVGEVGMESLSPDSFPDLVGCYPVISQISPHGPFSNTTVSFPEARRDRRGSGTPMYFLPNWGFQQK